MTGTEGPQLTATPVAHRESPHVKTPEGEPVEVEVEEAVVDGLYERPKEVNQRRVEPETD